MALSFLTIGDNIMLNKNVFTEDIVKKFEDIASKFYNLKHSFKLLTNCIQDEENVSLETITFALILREYFNSLKFDYNKLEEDLGIQN